ncbi:MAG TPA: cyclic nucleotide-binding domain-containing protein [Nitrososphaerales archaeon]|nr:cyclic nucleotide-binding domain-containing protein [Nitrososphaerales archaeon]
MAGPGAPDAAEMMASVPYFEGLSEKTRKAIASEGKVIMYDAGKTIVGEGGAGIGFYLVLEGRVEVRKGEKVLATLEKGQFFGEMSVIDGQPRSADVVAVSPTKCWVLVSWSFAGLLKGHPEIALPMLKELVRRLRAAQSAPAS